ncbi:MAG: polymerase sigma-70 factor, partial [Phycisphaerales bacterium]|nr:polymerase sigma-70 factor [Phycisphaerales bacterium]
MNETDEALVLKSQQQHDRPAFEELVRRTARLVFSRAYLETGDTHRAEDLAQETFLVAWKSIGQVTDPKG